LQSCGYRRAAQFRTALQSIGQTFATVLRLRGVEWKLKRVIVSGVNTTHFLQDRNLDIHYLEYRTFLALNKVLHKNRMPICVINLFITFVDAWQTCIIYYMYTSTYVLMKRKWGARLFLRLTLVSTSADFPFLVVDLSLFLVLVTVLIYAIIIVNVSISLPYVCTVKQRLTINGFLITILGYLLMHS